MTSLSAWIFVCARALAARSSTNTNNNARLRPTTVDEWIGMFESCDLTIGQGSIVDSFGDVEEIPFPRLAVIRRKSLTPERALFVSGVPAEDDQDRFSVQGVFAEEMTHAVLDEGTNYWRLDLPGVARDPVKTPESCLWVEQPQGQAFEKLASHSGKVRS